MSEKIIEQPAIVSASISSSSNHHPSSSTGTDGVSTHTDSSTTVIESTIIDPEKRDDGQIILPPTIVSEPEYLTGFKLFCVVVSLLSAIFCVSLDSTILATVIPSITSDFDTIEDIAWYGSAYLLTSCSLQMFYAKLYTYHNVKWVFLFALFLFELGSLVCGIAPTSTALIIGRAIAGCGSAGLFTGVTTGVSLIAPLKNRPLIINAAGGLYAFNSIIGPIVGGTLTDALNWRWCFYINLPIGVITLAGVLLYLRSGHDTGDKKKTSFGREWIMRYDPIGNSFLVCAVVTLLLAIEWGGNTYAWDSPRIIVLFVICGLSIAVFAAVQIWQGEKSVLPPRIMKVRSIPFGSLFIFCIGSSTFPTLYYLPIWFQAIKGDSAIMSAVHMLPTALSALSGTTFAGTMSTRIGYYMPFACACCVFMPLGAGLLMTIEVDFPTAKWIGYQVLYGFGIGMGFQQANVAVQASVAVKDVPIGSSIMFSSQLLGSSIFNAVAQNIFTSNLKRNIGALRLSDFTPQNAVDVGVTEIRDNVSIAELPVVLVAYNEALMKVFQLSLITSCMAVIGVAGMKWMPLRQRKPPADNS
ncbi:hypothetical protein PVAG01_00174 [Phlyctema vagabunda]|uniref:Major facilitator superfamily (MFS) profile domain-containing protein n=1 Tax=Phlyctema vagabunda TaxID=108571 RepID=A0ABR4PTV6_9HELO